MKLCSVKSRLKLALGAALAGVIVVVGTLAVQPGVSSTGTALAQDPESTGSILRVTASTPKLTVGIGDTVVLSINVFGLQNITEQPLGHGVEFNWVASEGQLSSRADGTSASYTAPSNPGVYIVTVSPKSECAGRASTCTATFQITAQQQGEAIVSDASPLNPEGEIPAVLTDSQGEQYEVFTPEEGGSFTGEDFSVSAAIGIVPNGGIIGLRMDEDGSASNAGMPSHRYTLSGNQYRISAIDVEGALILSYNLNGTVSVCVPVPKDLLTNISSLEMVNKNSDGTLTAMSSAVRIVPSISICGNTSSLPATIAVGIPGNLPPLPESESAEMLPATGGVAPSALLVIVSALLGSIVLITAGTLGFRIADRDKRNRA